MVRAVIDVGSLYPPVRALHDMPLRPQFFCDRVHQVMAIVAVVEQAATECRRLIRQQVHPRLARGCQGYQGLQQ